MNMSAVKVIRAWVVEAAEQSLTLETVDLGPLGVEDVEIAVAHCGLCHSDLSVLTNEWASRATPRSSGTRLSVALLLWVLTLRASTSDNASAWAGTRAVACTATNACREAITCARKRS
jgi:threonine dehydrogenase-like Zn-dependent dehydrogenase